MMRMMPTFGLGLLRTTLKQNLLVAALLGALAFTTTVSRAADRCLRGTQSPKSLLVWAPLVAQAQSLGNGT
jgi:hypothetical protein